MIRVGLLLILVSFGIYGGMEETQIIISGKQVKYDEQVNYLRIPKKNNEIRIFKREENYGTAETGEVKEREKAEGNKDSTAESKTSN